MPILPDIEISPETHERIARYNADIFGNVMDLLTESPAECEPAERVKIGRIEPGNQNLRAKLPPLIADGLDEFALYGWEPGGFLTAVLRNDFTDAVCRADGESLGAIRDIAKYVYNFLPGDCHGSREKVNAWIAKGKAVQR